MSTIAKNYLKFSEIVAISKCIRNKSYMFYVFLVISAELTQLSADELSQARKTNKSDWGKDFNGSHKLFSVPCNFMICTKTNHRKSKHFFQNALFLLCEIKRGFSLLRFVAFTESLTRQISHANDSLMCKRLKPCKRDTSAHRVLFSLM